MDAKNLDTPLAGLCDLPVPLSLASLDEAVLVGLDRLRSAPRNGLATFALVLSMTLLLGVAGTAAPSTSAVAPSLHAVNVFVQAGQLDPHRDRCHSFLWQPRIDANTDNVRRLSALDDPASSRHHDSAVQFHSAFAALGNRSDVSHSRPPLTLLAHGRVQSHSLCLS